MDIEGNWLWVNKAGSIRSEYAKGISIDNSGNSYVAGEFYGSSNFGAHTIISIDEKDIFVAKLERDFLANFFSTPDSVYLSLDVDFSDASSGNIDNWLWDFQNDGIYDSFDQNPSFTYTNVGIYDVKLKISNETQVDSLIKYNCIAVVYIPPAQPTDVQVDIVIPDAIISWSTVDTTIFGDPITPDGYIVLFSENEENYFYLFSTTDTTFTHIRVAEHRDNMFYQVVAFIDYSREQIEYLESLNNSREKIKWSVVKQNLEKGK